MGMGTKPRERPCWTTSCSARPWPGRGRALAAGPLGCFVLWRRIAYFGDATAHAALLGVALAVALALPVTVMVTLVAGLTAALAGALARRRYAMDAMLGALSHGALALGLIAAMLTPGVRRDLEGYLFGDVLTATWPEVGTIWAISVLALGLLVWRWRPLVNASISEEMAWAEGENPEGGKLLLTLILALTVAAGLKIIGALLIAAMLILPAAAARPLARTPEAMAFAAALIGVGSVFVGVYASEPLHLPSGPCVVLAALLAFILANAAAALRSPRRRRRQP